MGELCVVCGEHDAAFPGDHPVLCLECAASFHKSNGSTFEIVAWAARRAVEYERRRAKVAVHDALEQSRRGEDGER